MTLQDALDKNKGIGPGFHFLRHILSIAIVIFHCRQIVYWQHSADLLAAAGITDAAAAATAALNGPIRFTFEEITRPAFHVMVGMFFSLSGFLVAGSALRTASVRNFFVNRALRIFPALGVETLLSAFILGPLVTILPIRAYFTDPQFYRYFGNIVGYIYFYLPGVFVNTPIHAVNGQLWTLPSEFYCYLMMLFAMATNLIKRPDLLISIVVIALVVMLALFLYSPTQFNAKNQNFFTSWYIVAIFWFGVIFFLFAEKVVLNLSIFLACITLYWLTMFLNFATPLSGIFLTYCMVYIGFTKFPTWDRFVKADYSYGLFLYHFPIVQTYMYFLAPYWKNVPLIAQLAMAVALGVPTTLAFAAVSWRVVEKPALSLRSIFAKTKPVIAGGGT